MAPMVHGLEAQYAGKINFIYLDIDDPANQAVKREFGFNYQPEFYLLDGQGDVLQKWVGSVSQEQFEMVFAQYIQ
jgi:hypothetical protein